MGGWVGGPTTERPQDVQAIVPGFLLGLSLILAIGAQNAFVLRQGLRRSHVFAVCLTCALSDAVLIAAGVSGFGALSGAAPWVAPVLRWGGVVFLLAYGARSFLSAWRGEGALVATGGAVEALGPVLATCLALTGLNPHVYLDTVLLLGSVAAQYEGRRLGFGIGAVAASFVFFFALGYGARLLGPLFARPGAWRVLDAGVGCVMWAIAAGLMLG
jgi:L-lysine exporter family protein LysE/ArgO